MPGSWCPITSGQSRASALCLNKSYRIPNFQTSQSHSHADSRASPDLRVWCGTAQQAGANGVLYNDVTGLVRVNSDGVWVEGK